MKRHPQRVEDYLEHIAQAIERGIQYVEPFGSLAAFEQNQQVQDAVIRNLEIIGEAANQIQGASAGIRRRTSRTAMDPNARHAQQNDSQLL